MKYLRSAARIVGTALALFGAATGGSATVIDIGASGAADHIEEQIGDRDVIFYAIDLETGDHFAYQPERIDERHIPYSSFKIPNLVIALETGVATSLQHERAWNEQLRPAESYWPSDWKQNQTLESAFKRSAPWYFQDVALEVGGDRYRRMLEAFGYGNAEVPDANDEFWLEGPLMISPKEQALFLERVVTESLSLQPTTLESLGAASFLDEMSEHRIYGKTGSGPIIAAGEDFEGLDEFDGEFEGWLVGWVNKPTGSTVVYALYVRGPDYGSIQNFRGRMSVALLRAIGALPAA